MKRAIYHLDNRTEYEIIETTSEGLLIEYTDDEFSSRLTLETNRQKREDIEDGYGSK